MTKRARTVAWATAVVLALAVLWYLFRPETLFFDKVVDEPFPGTETSHVEAPDERPSHVSSTGLEPSALRLA